MQRVLFLVERSGERIMALVNPERLEFTRRSGIRVLRHATGVVTGAALSDDNVLPTGGGSTEMVLDLLFDVDLIEPFGGAPQGAAQRQELAVGQALPVMDVRELTRPFWNLAENQNAEGYQAAMPLVRFIWGRSWNVLCVVTAVAERFERFDEEGRPRRSFLRASLRRVSEPEGAHENNAGLAAPLQGVSATPFYELPAATAAASPEGAARIEVQVNESGLPNLRLDEIAARVYGDPACWRIIAAANSILDPLRMEAGTVLALPPRSGLEVP